MTSRLAPWPAMGRRPIWLLAFASGGLAAPAVIAPSAAGAAGEVRVTIVNMSFQPSATTIDAGDTVTWMNQGFIPHTVTAVEGGFDSGRLSGGRSFSFTFPTPGTYPYFCTIHPNMKGEVVVSDDGHSPSMVPGMPGGALPGGGAGPPAPSGQGMGEVVRVRLSRERGARRGRLLIHIQAPRPEARVLLEFYSREHFAWREASHGALNTRGLAIVPLRSFVGARLRVVVVGPSGQRALVSRVFKAGRGSP
jgi:plastocyanin